MILPLFATRSKARCNGWSARARVLECDLPPTQICEGITRRMGQDLFAPPNVKGWDGGITWITTTTLLDRYNTAAILVQGADIPQARLEAMQQMAPDGRQASRDNKPNGSTSAALTWTKFFLRRSVRTRAGW